MPHWKWLSGYLQPVLGSLLISRPERTFLLLLVLPTVLVLTVPLLLTVLMLLLLLLLLLLLCLQWCNQGVLLLNAVLTVRATEANSHAGRITTPDVGANLGWRNVRFWILQLCVRTWADIAGQPARMADAHG